MSDSYIVKIHAKSRRPSARQRSYENPLLRNVVPAWTFGNEAEALDFAKTFVSCWVEVHHQGKVIYKNFDDSIKPWVLAYRENRVDHDATNPYERVNAKARDEQWEETQRKDA